MNTRLLMILRVNVATPQNIGAVPHGARRTAPFSGGDFEGPRLRGTVLPGGSADWLLLRADGVLEMDLRVTLRTDDGALISMTSFGLRHGPPEVMAAIGRGETVDPPTTLLFSHHTALRDRAPCVLVLESSGRSRQRAPLGQKVPSTPSTKLSDPMRGQLADDAGSIRITAPSSSSVST